ncbi:MAG: NTP transferase domain-containing protein [Nocardioidaceae bacterium]
MSTQVAILAAGLGTRLGRPFPKPLTRLTSGQTILERQIDNLRTVLGQGARIHLVVGFKHDLIMEAAPDVLFAYNEVYDQTNTSKSLLKALQLSGEGGVLWMNGDVVFDAELLEAVVPRLREDQSFVCVNTASVAEEEVKYTVDGDGYIAELSKQVANGLGEAVGINFVSPSDKAGLLKHLEDCDSQDYFERAIELAIAEAGQRWLAVDVSAFDCMEVDFQEDLDAANALLAAHAARDAAREGTS